MMHSCSHHSRWLYMLREQVQPTHHHCVKHDRVVLMQADVPTDQSLIPIFPNIQSLITVVWSGTAENAEC